MSQLRIVIFLLSHRGRQQIPQRGCTQREVCGQRILILWWGTIPCNQGSYSMDYTENGVNSLEMKWWFVPFHRTSSLDYWNKTFKPVSVSWSMHFFLKEIQKNMKSMRCFNQINEQLRQVWPLILLMSPTRGVRYYIVHQDSLTGCWVNKCAESHRDSFNLLAASVHWTCSFNVKWQQVSEQCDANVASHSALNSLT